MKPYIKPEIISVEMLSASMLAGTGAKHGDTLGKPVITNGEFYSKSDNAWDDFDE